MSGAEVLGVPACRCEVPKCPSAGVPKCRVLKCRSARRLHCCAWRDVQHAGTPALQHLSTPALRHPGTPALRHIANPSARLPPAPPAGTTTPTSTTGRTPRRWRAGTCRSGPGWRRRRRAGPGAGLRHGANRAAGRPQRDAHGRHRLVGADARAGADPSAPRAAGPARAPGARRHPAPARFPIGHFAPRDGALRHPAVAGRRRRLARHAGRGGRCACDPAAGSSWSWWPICRHGTSTSNQTKLRGWRAGGRSHVTLIESVRQDRTKGLTLFEQEFVERRGRARTSRRFTLAFRTAVGAADGRPARTRRPARHRAPGQLRRRSVDEDVGDVVADRDGAAERSVHCNAARWPERRAGLLKCLHDVTAPQGTDRHAARAPRHSAPGTALST